MWPGDRRIWNKRIKYKPEVVMKKSMHAKPGVVRIVKEYRKIFRIPENLNFYSAKDYQKAERKFLKYALYNGHTARRLQL